MGDNKNFDKDYEDTNGVVRDSDLESSDTKPSKSKANRKDIIKNIAIAFLAILLLLTFFSNTIMNYSLPEVATQSITSGKVSPQIRGTGTVTADDPYNITLTQTRKIASVAVKEGDHVDVDDIIYYLEDKESDELQTARDELENLELAYEQALFSGNVPDNVITRVRNGKTISYDSYQTQLRDVNDRYNAAVAADAQADQTINYLTQKKAYDQSEVSYDQATPEYTSAQATNDIANANREKSDVSSEITELNAEVSSIESKITALKAQLVNTNTASSASSSSSTDGETSANAEEKNALINQQIYQLMQEESDIKADISGKQAYQSTLEQQISDYQAILDNNAKDQAQLGTYNNQLGISYDQKLNEATQNKNNTAQTLKDVTEERSKLLTSINSEISLASQRDIIEKKKAKIAKLEENSVGATVKAPVAGTINSLTKTAGESANADEAIAVITVDGKPMTTSFSVTTAQAAKLKIGDFANPQNAWYYNDFKAKLSSIKADTSDPAGHKLLTFTIESTDVTPGQSVSLSIGEASKEYDRVIPNSAVRTDSNGKFVLIAQSHSTPLGNRYIAKRENIEVIATDDTNSAISGNFDGYEYVITTSSRPIQPGDQVRLAE